MIAARHRLLQLEHPRGALAPDLERLGQRGAEELVDPPEHRVIGAAGEAPVLHVAEAERHERRLLELGLELSLGPVVELGQALRQPGHLERALAEVVGLLGVEQQDAVRHLGLGHHDGDGGVGAEGAHRGEAVVAVGRPVVAVVGAHDDHRVEVAAEPVDGGAELGDVGVGEVALVGRGLDQVDRQSGEDLPVAAERIAVRGEDGAAVGLDRLGQPGDGGGRRAGAQRVGRDAAERGAPSGRFFRRGFLAVLVSAM